MWEWVGGRGGEGESRFNRGVCLSDGGGGFACRLCVCPMGGIGFDGRGDFEKKCRMGGRPLMPPPPAHYGKPCQLYIPEIGVIM